MVPMRMISPSLLRRADFQGRRRLSKFQWVEQRTQQRVTLTPTLSRKRERGRAVSFLDVKGLNARRCNLFSRWREKVSAKKRRRGDRLLDGLWPTDEGLR